MSKLSKPNSEEEVFVVMKDYSEKKGYSLTDTQLDYMAQSCFLLFESRGWVGIKYWPAVAMKWVLTNVYEQRNHRGRYDVRGTKSYEGEMKPRGKSVREKIMEQENDRDRV